MSQRNWMHRLAIGGCLVASLFAGESQAQSSNYPLEGQSQQQPAAQTPVPLPPAQADDRQEYRPACNRPADREDANFCEQRRAADAAQQTVYWAREQTHWTKAQALWAEHSFYAGAAGTFLVVVSLFFTGWAAFAAAKAVEAANKSASIAETALRVSERAKLWVDEIAVRSVAVDTAPRAVYRIANTGRTHADVISVQSGYGISSEEDVPVIPPYKSSEDPTRPGIIGPSSAQEIEITFREPITQQEAFDIAEGRKFIFVYGRVVCRDEFQWICEVGFGGQYGNHGDGSYVVQFMRQPGYTYIRWHPPSKDAGSQPAQHSNRNQL